MVCIEIILQSKMKEKPNAHRNVIYSAFGCEMTVYNFNAVGLRVDEPEKVFDRQLSRIIFNR